MEKTLARRPQQEAHQTVRLDIDTKDTTSSIRICFTDQRLTAHGGMIVWSHFLHQKRFRQQLRDLLPHAPTSPNAYDSTDVALGYVAGILCGADKLSRVGWLQSDPAIAPVLGVEAVASQSTLSRFFGAFGQRSCNALAGLHRQAVWSLPSLKEGYTLDLDSWALLHEDGHLCCGPEPCLPRSGRDFYGRAFTRLGRPIRLSAMTTRAFLILVTGFSPAGLAALWAAHKTSTLEKFSWLRTSWHAQCPRHKQ